MNTQQALLSNEANYTVFRFGDKTIRFRAPYSLERYTGIQEWDHGYLVVLAKYRHDPNPEEEYIDLVPILKNLYFDPDEFLAPIKGVKLATEARQEMTLAFSLLRCYTELNALRKGGYTCNGLERLRFLQKRKPLSFSGSKCTLLYLSAERGA